MRGSILSTVAVVWRASQGLHLKALIFDEDI